MLLKSERDFKFIGHIIRMEVFGKLRLTDHIEGKRGREKHSLTFVANYVNGYQNRERGVEKETNIAKCYKGK